MSGCNITDNSEQVTFFLFCTEGDDVPECEDVTCVFRADRPFSYSFWDVQARNVNSVLGRAREMGLTHIIHIDDDELIYNPRGADAFFKI